MKNHLITIALVAFAALVSCNKKPGFQTTPSGLEYRIDFKNNAGKTGNVGDYYFFNLIVKRSNDSVIANTYQSGEQSKFLRRKSLYPGDIYEALAMAAVGDSITIRLVADSFYNSHGFPFPDNLVPGEKLTFVMKITDILNTGGFKMKMFSDELSEIEDFLRKKQWEVKTDTATGIKYQLVQNNPQGVQISAGDSVDISYFYYYLNDQIIARSKVGEDWRFLVGDPAHIKGLSRVLTFMKSGEKIRAIIPFNEAFGEDGMGGIPPFSTLVMEIETHLVKKAKP